jgi:hypothetical protein
LHGLHNLTPADIDIRFGETTIGSGIAIMGEPQWLGLDRP